MKCCCLNCTCRAPETAHELMPCCYFHAAGSLSQRLGLTCMMTVAFMLLAPLRFGARQVRNLWQVLLCTERGMFIREHRSAVVCCVCSVAESVCLSFVVMLCACEQVVDVELGTGVPHISNLQALASPSSTIWPQALFDLDFTGNMSICTQNTGGVLSFVLFPFELFGSKHELSAVYAWLVSLCMLRPHHAQVIVVQVANTPVFSTFKRFTQVASKQSQ